MELNMEDKKMKNFRTEKLNSLSLAALLMAGATFTACSSDDAATEQNPAQKTYTLTVNATKGGDATTRALSIDGEGQLIATWATTENIYVKKGGTSVGTLNPDDSGTLATLKGELTGDFAVGQTLDLTFPRADIDYTGQVGTLADIAAKYDYATATATITSVNGSTIGADNGSGGNVIFQNQQAIIKFTLLDKADDAAISPSALTVTDGTSTVSLTSIPADTYTANGDGVLYVAFPAAGSAKTITLTATVDDDTYTYEKSGATFTNEEYYDIAVKMTKQAPAAPEGAINGKFTVNASGDQVYFSKGNLQATYNGSAWSWGFATNQWDYIGSAAANTSVNGNGTVSANGTVDLFGWVGASSTWTGAAMYGISNSNNISTDGYGNNKNENLKSDWGTLIGTGWRTLTSTEWNYLFLLRTTGGTVGSTSNAHYTHATINTDGTSVNGMILFPDGVNIANSTDYFTSLGSVNNTSAWGTKCTSAQWIALAAKGCVFLPAAGYRASISSAVSLAGTRGMYWSSSPDPAANGGAYRIDFESNSLATNNNNGDRRYGFSVRLVKDAE